MNINLTLIGQMVTFVFFVRVLHEVCLAAHFGCHGRACETEDMPMVWLLLTVLATILNWPRKRQLNASKEAKHEAAGIVEAANKRASQIVEEAKDTARSRSRASRENSRAGRNLNRKLTGLANNCVARLRPCLLQGRRESARRSDRPRGT